MNVRDLAHAILPHATQEELSRQRTVVAIRKLLNARVRPRNVEAYEAEGAPGFAAREGRAPQSPDEVRRAFFHSPRYRMWSATNRAVQEMLWVSVGEPVYRDEPRMRDAARALIDASVKLGSLTLDPDHAPSPEVADVDIHLQPGGYALRSDPEDIVAGALYETGGNVFSFGQGIGRGDSKTAVVVRLLDTDYPDLKPLRILDLGCSAGAASAAYAAAYPEAEVHAIDIGAAMLRYAHARAESLGVAVHFHQMDASNLGFDDADFDLVVSHNLLHEIGTEKRRAMMIEAARVVRPGGVVVHQDVPIRALPSLVQQVERDWDTTHNGEAHWAAYMHADLMADMRAAGLDPIEHDLPAISGPNRWYAISARR